MNMVSHWVCSDCSYKREYRVGSGGVFRFYPEGPKCPECGGDMTLKSGEEGETE